MATLVTKPAPGFTATAVMGDNEIKDVSLSDYKGKYVVLFFYPLDWTFVCPSEIVAFDEAVAEFEKRNCVVLGCSVDSEWTHLSWKRAAKDEGGIGQIKFPLLADLDKSISRKYGVLMDDAVALRGLFLIDKEGNVRHETINDLPLGRNVREVLRLVDALTFVDDNEAEDLVCPANWEAGQDAMTASPEGVADYLGKH
ncbi:MAG: redoxin domain-containing protein [Armatimonadia bacterium]|nr:redoxin domain-containing protein [Armatimonadia bacterium]